MPCYGFLFFAGYILFISYQKVPNSEVTFLMLILRNSMRVHLINPVSVNVIKEIGINTTKTDVFIEILAMF